jgi:prolyl 4-hydroxylase
MKEHYFDNNSFIGGWYIPGKVCDDMISFFDTNKNKHIPGYSYNCFQEKNIINKEFKDSIDLNIETDMFGNNEVFNYIQQLSNIITAYEIKYPMAKNNSPYALIDFFNMQYYPPGAGFKAWHHERFKSSRNRVFVFMTYLNDVPDGGTEFYHQQITSPAKKGLTIMWPSEWTHTHRGQVSKKHNKYIVTGWFKYT